MTTHNLSFSKQVREWSEKAMGAVDDVRKHSAKDVYEESISVKSGRMRAVTGFLRSSVLASTASMPRIDPLARPVPGRTYVPDGSVEVVILNSKPEDTIYLGFTAAYAAHREYGARGSTPDAFVRTAKQKWPSIVKSNVSKARAKYGL